MRFISPVRGFAVAFLASAGLVSPAFAQVNSPSLAGRYEPYILSASANAYTYLNSAYVNETKNVTTYYGYYFAVRGYNTMSYAVNTTLPAYLKGQAPWSQYYTFLSWTYTNLYYSYLYSYYAYLQTPTTTGLTGFYYAYYSQAYAYYSLFTPQIAPPSDGLTDELRSLRDLHNSTRVANGLGQLTSDSRLNAAAQLHANWMAANQNMTHTESDGSQPIDRAERQGYTGSTYGVGENVAYGYTNISDVFTAWMNSDGHRHNILNGAYQNIGIGVATASNGSRYWCVVFGYIQ